MEVKPDIKVEALVLKPRAEALQLGGKDPQFATGSSHTATVTLTNPTAKQWTYTVELYLNANKAATSGQGTVTIPANSSVNATFTVVMPAAEGTFTVFLDVLESGSLIKHYQATDTITTAIPPDITVGPITWA